MTNLELIFESLQTYKHIIDYLDCNTNMEQTILLVVNNIPYFCFCWYEKQPQIMKQFRKKYLHVQQLF